MKRPLFLVGTTLLFSVWVSFLLTVKQGFILSGATLLTAVLMVVLKKDSLKTITVILLSAALGLGVGSGYLYLKIEPFSDYLNKEVVLEGIVYEAKANSARSVRYIINAVYNEDLPSSSIIIRDYIGAELKQGDKVRCRVKLQYPKYDRTQSYYLRSGVPMEGVLLEQPELLEPSGMENFWVGIINIRKKIKIKNMYIYSEESEVLVSSMVFGMTEDLPPDIYSDLNRSGTSHLLSVSGLHLSVFTAFIIFLLGATPIPKNLQWLIAIFVAIGFTVLVGFSPPIIRSCIMLVLMLLGNMISRKSDSVNSLGFSAIIICLVWPYWVLSLGMWLSYFATLGILLVGTKLSEKLYKRYKRSGVFINWLIKIVTASFGITVGAYIFTLPILVIKTGWFSLISPLANLLVSPFSAIVVIGGILCAVLPTGILFYPLFTWLVDKSCKMIIVISKLLAKVPFAAFSVDHILIFVAVIVAAVIAILAVIYRKKAGAVILAVVLAVTVISLGEIGAVFHESNKVQLVFLGGSQSKVLIRGKAAVVIGVPDKYGVEDLIKYLQYRDISGIDCLFAHDTDYPIDSAILRLEGAYNIKSIIGPDDAVVLEELAGMLPGVPVYASGYSEVDFLGGVTAKLVSNSDDLELLVGMRKVLLTSGKYDILKSTNDIIITDEEMILPRKLKPQPDILGRGIYNERRVHIPV